MAKSLNTGKQLKIGAVLSYLLIILNTVYGLFVSPFLLTQLGDSDYGVYKTIASFSATLLVLDLGIGTTVMRYTAKFRAEKKYDSIGNFAAMGLIEAAIMGTLICLVSSGIYFSINGIYSNAFTESEVSLAKTIFLIMVVNIVGTIVDNVFSGIIMGANHFAFANGLKLSLLLFRMLLIFVVICYMPSAIILVTISLLITVIGIVANCTYVITKLKIRIRITSWDKRVFEESLGYTTLMFMQTIAVQANGNIDNIVIGAVAGSATVTVYSFGIQMYHMYESLATSFSNLMLPSVCQKIEDGASDSELQAVVTRVGRLQFIVLGATLVGFACVGQDFIWLWLGDNFGDVYYLSLIMMVPVTFTLIENVCLSILRARNLMKFRTASLFIAAAFNAVFTVVGMMLFNYYAAALGTALSIVCGSIIMMNIYYHKRIGFKVFRFYRDVTRRLAVCMLVPGIVLVLLNFVLSGSWFGLAAKIAVYCVIYFLLLVVYGLNKDEKRMLFGKFVRRRING